MLRRSVFSVAMRASFAVVLAAGLIAGLLPSTVQAQAQAGSKQLQRISGNIGWSTQKDGSDFTQVFGKFELPDPDYAVTHAKSTAQIAMPDSSLILLGENTSVQVSAFDNATASPGATITVNDGSHLRFEIKRPAGGAASYKFVTATSQVAVRGTVGLLAFVNGITTVGCVVCAADSVVVQVGTQTFALAAGQFITVSALGAVTTGALSAVTGAFAGAGVSTGAASGAAGAAGAAAGAIVPAAAGAAAAAAAIGIAASQSSPTPQPTATNASPNATPSGSVNITSKAQAAPTPSPTPHPPVAAPTHAPGVAPPFGPPPGPPGSMGRRSQ